MSWKKICIYSGAFILGISQATAQTWPPLPQSGYLSGRPASEKDVADGNAVFVAKVDSKLIGVPLPIAIPQYAYVTDPHITNGGPPLPVIVVQAEEANGYKLFGVRDFSKKEYVTTETDLKLLGITSPQ